MERAFHDQYYRAQQEIRLADLAKTSQMSHETPQEYLSRFKLARARCRVRLPESEFVDMAMAGLSFKFREHFEGVTFNDLFELETRLNRYDAILREETEKRAASKGTYYKNQAVNGLGVDLPDDPVEVDLAEVVIKQPRVCKALERVDPKETKPPVTQTTNTN